MVVLVTCKNEEDPSSSIKNEGARVFTTLYIDFSDFEGQLSVICYEILLKFEFIQAFMYVLIRARMKKIQLKLRR